MMANMNIQPTHLASVGRSAIGRTHEPRSNQSASSNAAHRRLAATILRLDVATLAVELKSARVQNETSLGRAA
jgi:hypothetical protein